VDSRGDNKFSTGTAFSISGDLCQENGTKIAGKLVGFPFRLQKGGKEYE